MFELKDDQWRLSLSQSQKVPRQVYVRTNGRNSHENSIVKIKL